MTYVLQVELQLFYKVSSSQTESCSTENSSFCKSCWKSAISDWLTDRRTGRRFLEHAHINKRNIKNDDSEISTAQTPIILNGGLAVLEEVCKTYTMVSEQDINCHADCQINDRYVVFIAAKQATF